MCVVVKAAGPKRAGGKKAVMSSDSESEPRSESEVEASDDDSDAMPMTPEVSRIPCHFAQSFWAYELPHRREIVPGAVF